MKNRARWVIFTGVLLGLFFSGGEGIRLVPFPHASETEASGKEFSKENSTSYNLSVRHFGGGNRADATVKFQKNSNRQPFALAADYSRFDSVTHFRLTRIEFPTEVKLNVSYRAVISASDRAPPVI